MQLDELEARRLQQEEEEAMLKVNPDVNHRKRCNGALAANVLKYNE